MINFRFHLVSLVAIFLALALGVVIGAGVIDRGVVDALDNRLNSVEARSDSIEAENGDLRDLVAEQDASIAELGRHVAGTRLGNVDVGVVAVRGVDEDRVDQTVAVLRDGGAKVTGVLWLERPWNLDEPDQVTALANAIGSSSRRRSTLRNQAWQEMAARFAQPLSVTTTTLDPSATGSAAPGDVLDALDEAGFVSFEAPPDGGDLDQFPGLLASIVLVVGSAGDVSSSNVVMPAATALTAEAFPLVAGDVYDAEAPDAGARGSAFATLRDSDLSTEVSTVDDLDRPVGPPTVALALIDLLRIPPTVGHYGLGEDTALAPDPVVP